MVLYYNSGYQIIWKGIEEMEIEGSLQEGSLRILDQNGEWTFEEHLPQYDKHMLDRNLAKNTRKMYMSVVRKIYDRYDGQITKTNLLAWKTWMLDEHKYKASSANLYIIAINQYLKWIGRPELCLKITKVPKTNYLDNSVSFRSYQKLKIKLLEDNRILLYQIVCTFATTGLRVSELVKLNVEDIRNGSVDIHSKGDRIRRVYFPKKLKVQLTEWLKSENRLDSDGPLFINANGGRLSISSVQAMFARAKKRYKIPGLHPHALRHLFAFTWLQKMSRVKQPAGQRQFGVLPILAEILGHKSLDTVFIYLQPSSAELKAYADRVDW